MIQVKWKFLSVEAKDYDFGWRKWTSYPVKLVVWDDSFKFKWTKEIYDKLQWVPQFTEITCICVLKTSTQWGNYLQFSSVEIPASRSPSQSV